MTLKEIKDILDRPATKGELREALRAAVDMLDVGTLLVKDKWDDYVLQNANGVEYAALDLVKRRLDEGFWYNNWDDGIGTHQYQTRAEEIVRNEDANAALAFLLERREFEYEWVEIR